MPHTRIGTDLVDVETIAESVRTFGHLYLNRVFTPAEIDYCQQGGAEQSRRLAARFAAKEACMKVLRPLDGGIPWPSIEVIKMPGGWCELQLHGAARLLADSTGITHLSLSLSHEASMAVAVVAATVNP